MRTDIIEEDDIDGAIQSIHVRNFFCHDNLEINLNRNVNFIVGRNGSGKSAILTALVVGLGGRASATNRGSNLHSFIKKGANSATVEIKIRNNSSKAYKHEMYGDYITIVRHITSSGGSNYKVKSATGEIISTKFEEVNAIILAHDIQVDNPISVLNQDDARSFHAADAKKKYSLFRKATNLDQTETNYVWAKENCNKATDIWNRKTVAYIELEKEYKKWKTSHEQLQSRDEIEAKKQALQNEYYWSEIAKFENEVSIVQAQYDKQRARIDTMVEKLNQMKENNGSSNDIINTLQEQMAAKSTERSTLEQEMCDLESQVREVQMSLRSAQSAAAKHKELFKRENSKVNDLEREIQNIDSGSAVSQRAALERRAQSAQEAAAAARARYDTAQHDAEQSRAAAAHGHAHADRAAATAQRHADTLKQLKQQLRELESRGSDSLAVYGNNMVVLCQKIKEADAKGHFSAPPRGPVGAYIKVREKKWGGALEHIIGRSVGSFCVNTAEDSRKLFEIMRNVYGTGAKPGVTSSQFLNRVHDVRRHAVVASGYRSALDSLHVTDPVVANYLIDNVGLEKVLLVPEHEDATRLSDTPENVPINCSKIVTLDCTEYHPAPNYRCYGGAARPARYLHQSTAERKAQVLAEIEEAESTYHTLKAKAEEANRAAEEARVNASEASRVLQALLAERHQKDEAARIAAAALDQQQAPHHAVLVEELNVSKEKLRSLTQQLQQLTSQEQECRHKFDEYDVRIRKVKKKLGELSSACRTMREEIEQEQLKLDQCVTERRTYQEKLKEDNVKVSKIECVLNERRAIIDKKTQEALTLCPKVENPRELSIVTAELKKTQLNLSSIRSDGLSRAQVAEKLLDVERKYRRTKHTLDRLKTLIDQIQNTADKHLEFCHTVQTCIARRVQYWFQSILDLRGYSGRMDIDNARCLLEITCTGREASGKRHAATTSSLSGGERSYSTVAFIMALWECVELPFYFMDEFDVFMDNVNRKIVMELLVDHALHNPSRQFVFLTPQDASAITASDRITIHLMADPRP